MRRANSTWVSPRTPAHPAGEAAHVAHRLGVVVARLAGNVLLAGRIQHLMVDPPRGEGPAGCPDQSSTVFRSYSRTSLAVGLAGRNDAYRRAPHGADHHEHPPLYRAQQPVADLAVVLAPAHADDPVLVEECVRDVREVEAAIRETGIALGVVLLELHAPM